MLQLVIQLLLNSLLFLVQLYLIQQSDEQAEQLLL